MGRHERRRLEKQKLAQMKGMIWRGTEELVIGCFDEKKQVRQEYRVQPGQVIPEPALKLMLQDELKTGGQGWGGRDGEYNRDQAIASLLAKQGRLNS